MNSSEDRPTSDDRPAPYGDPPEQPRMPPAPGGPPADAADEPLESFAAPAEPAARWEDVVDPKLTAPETAVVAERAAATAGEPVAPDLDDYDDDYDPGYDEARLRWVSLLATIGTALIGIVTVQVLTSLVEAFTLKSGQRVGIPDDLFHRIGYPFGGLGATALVFLVLGVVLVSLPSVFDELLSEAQDRVVGVALIVAIVMSVIIAVGSLLAVRANMHEYAAKDVALPRYVQVQFTNFLLGALGAAALALFGAIAAINERSREQFD